MLKINKYGFFAIYSACFFIILYKALTVPITHDETATTVHYINYGYWEIMMYPDSWPNNHILNTLGVKYLSACFGKEQWVVRLPSLFAFLVYAYSVYLLLKLIVKPDGKLFLFLALIFLINFYLLDFFSLSRGYALSCSFVTLSAIFILKSFLEKNDSYQWLGFIFAIISSYANFTSLVYLICACLLFVFYFFIKNKYRLKVFNLNFGLFLMVCVGYGLLIITPILKMKQDDQFRFWTSNGFIKETVFSFIDCFKYGSVELGNYENSTVSYILMGLIIVIELFWIIRIIKHKNYLEVFNNPIFLSNTILLLTVLISILNSLGTNTPYLNGRTALLFYPLFSIVICSLLAALKATNFVLQFSIGICILWFSIWHYNDTFKFTSFREWWFDENTFKVMEILRQDSKCQTIKLKVNWLFHPSFFFYSDTKKYPDLFLYSNSDMEIDANTDADYYFVLRDNFVILQPKFHEIASFPNGGVLLKRNGL